jgi:hypothetical protein
MSTYLPNARRNIVEMLDNAMTATMIEVQEQSFREPYTDENLNLMLEALAAAAGKMVAKSPNRAALIQTFAYGLLDNVEK